MLFDSLATVLGTGRVHGADAAPDSGQVIQGFTVNIEKVFIKGCIRLRFRRMRAPRKKKHADHDEACGQPPAKKRESGEILMVSYCVDGIE